MDEQRIALSKYRIEKSWRCVESAELLVEANDYCSAANRSYYAIFHSMRSILALDGVDFAKHAGVIAYFQKHYVKTGIFEKVYSKILTEAFEIRTESDYDDYYMLSKVEVEEQIEHARFFTKGVENYVQNKISGHGNRWR